MGQGRADHPPTGVGLPRGAPGREPPSIPGVCALVRLDAGRLSEVYRGRCTRTGGAVAVKVLPAPFDRDTRAEFDADRTQLGRLRHIPAILQVDDVDVLDDGRPYLVTELCTHSLAEQIERGERLSAATVASHGHQLATALDAAHGAGIVHGGVSPRNLLFRRVGQAVLSDFGLTLRQRYPGNPDDSPEYIAPETLRDGTLTARSDLYCLGATLYAALSGRPPFAARVGEHPSERILRVISQPTPRLDQSLASPELAELLAQLTATEPAERPVDAASVAARFADLSDADPSDADLTVGDQSVCNQSDAVRPDEPGPAELMGDNGSTNWSGLLDDSLYEPEPDDDPIRPRTEPVPAPDDHVRPRPAISRPRVAALISAVLASFVLLVTLPRLGQAMSPSVAPAAGQTPPAGGGSPTPSGQSSVTAAAPPAVQFVAVRDRGQTVELTWRGATTLEYAVVIAGSGLPTQAVLAHHAQSMRLRVHPDRQYCFLIQATDGQRVLQSQPRSIRNAVCRL